MRISQLLFLFQVIGTAMTQSQDCELILEELNVVLAEMDIVKFFQLVGKDAGYSGKGFNRWGDYDACQREPNNYYVVMEVLGLGLPQFSGVCVNKNCTPTDLNILIAPQINELISNQFKTEVFTVFVEPDSSKPDMTPRTPILITIMIILVILTLVEPAYNIYQQIIFKPKVFQDSGDENLHIQQKDLASSIFKTEAELRIQQQVPPKMKNQFFKIFSLTENINIFTDFKTPDQNLTIFTGTRVFAFFMVVFGHQFAINLLSVDAQMLIIVQKWWLCTFLADCLFSVDIFFWIGGFFLGFVMVEKKKVEMLKKSGLLAIPGIILHRVLRIWPCYLICIFFVWSIEPYLAHGPRQMFTQQVTDCSVWWRNILFISTFYSDGKDCMGWGWYLTTDMQLFVMSLVPIFIYARFSKILSKIIIIYYGIFTQVLGLIVSYEQELKVPLWSFLDTPTAQRMFDTYYTKTYCRGTVYFIGLFLGIMYREYKAFKTLTQSQQAWMRKPLLFNLSKIVEKKVATKIAVQVIFYIIGFGIMIYISVNWRVTQIHGEDYWSDSAHSFYFGVCRTVFCIGLSIVAIVGMIGIKDWFNTDFMDCTLFKFIAKLSFTGYLIHYIVIVVESNNFYEQQEFSLFYQGNLFLGNLLITLFFATLMTIMVEQPFGKIDPKKKKVENLVQQNLIEK